ncbi:MAG TPA: hypothetical protein VNC22_16730 [Sporichthya sp.]|jgi:hypothetical protein|nr:hypothetical protein [Sporichthya sp.]
MKLLERRSDPYAAANRPAGVNASRWLAIGLALPALYLLALVAAVLVDAWRAGA